MSLQMALTHLSRTERLATRSGALLTFPGLFTWTVGAGGQAGMAVGAAEQRS